MEIYEILGISNDKIIEAKEILKHIDEITKDRSILSTGSKNFDKVLNGGFQRGVPYLIFGQNRTGKTQLCHQLCIQAYTSFKESKSKFNILYIDCENTFRPERLTELCGAREMDTTEVLRSISISNIMSLSSFLRVLDEIEKRLKITPKNMLIIDSINNHFRSEQGDPEKSYNQVKTDFIELLKRIDLLTKKYGCFTIATAQVTPNFTENAIIEDLPVGNLFLNHFFSEFLYLSIKEENKRFVHLINSQTLPEKKILYKITAEGIEDYRL